MYEMPPPPDRVETIISKEHTEESSNSGLILEQRCRRVYISQQDTQKSGVVSHSQNKDTHTGGTGSTTLKKYLHTGLIYEIGWASLC